jgi:pyruvate/2-oxoglutarate dehydrogenase complex dihydrolipoamide dehydrogenase (E3) component
MRHAAQYGLADTAPVFSFTSVMQRVQAVIAAIAPHDSIERYTALGAEVLQGHASLITPWTVEITHADGRTQRLTSRAIVLATGARPSEPALPGLDTVGYLTSDTLWAAFAALDALPRRLLVLGGGAMGCELAQSFQRLGAQVTQVESAPRLLGREDADVSTLIEQSLQADGVRVLTGHQALRCEPLTPDAPAPAPFGPGVLVAQHRGKRCASNSTPCCAPSAAAPGCQATGWRRWAFPPTARSTPTTTCKPSTPTFLPPGMWPGPTS